MEKIKEFAAEIAGVFTSFLCWFSPQHCDHVAKILAVMIGTVTLFFITLPRAWPNIRRIFDRK